jgi:DNA-binding MarR family transcriptional regulator
VPKKGSVTDARATGEILRHWRDAVPNDRLAHLVKDATRALLRALQMRLTAHSVALGHWTFLRILWEEDGLTQRELSSLAGVMEPTTYAALNAMEELGYVVRRRRHDNRKNIYVFLTPRGRQLKAKLVPLAVEVNEIAVQGSAESDIATTRRILLTILENLARDEAARTSGTTEPAMKKARDRTPQPKTAAKRPPATR